MPSDAPKSLSDDVVYAVTAYNILHRNGLVVEDEALNEANLASVEMPNRGNFIDPWAKHRDIPYQRISIIEWGLEPCPPPK